MRFNPRMLMLARELRGLSQTDLAKDLKSISQATYSRLEKGIVEMQNDYIEEISDILDFPKEFFYKEEMVLGDSQEYFYRKRQTLPKKQQNKLEATFDLIRMIVENLLSQIDIPDFRIPEIEIEYTNTPEKVALNVRRYLGCIKGPIGDLISLLEKNGIIVYMLKDAPDKFDGTTVITKTGTRVIVLNDNMPNYRKRFTIAHELGHIVCHIPFPNFNPFRMEADVEKEADRFASEFLMPTEEIKRDLYKLTYSKLADIKGYWKASKSSIIYKAYSLGCIDEQRFIYLMTELSRYNERKNENSDVTLDRPRLIKLMIESYYDDLGYTETELQKSLLINASDFENLLSSKVRKMSISI